MKCSLPKHTIPVCMPFSIFNKSAPVQITCMHSYSLLLLIAWSDLISKVNLMQYHTFAASDTRETKIIPFNNYQLL